MDRLDGLLREHQGRDAFVLRCEMAPPWAIRVADGSRLAVVIMIEGSLRLRFDDAASGVLLAPGDVALVRGERPYLLGDDDQTFPSAVIETGQVCRSLLGPDAGPADAARAMEFRGRVWGNAPGGPTSFLTGVYELGGQLSGRLLEALPQLAVLPAPGVDPALTRLLGAELDADRPGQSALLDRLVDLVLVSAVRAWFSRPDADPPPWWSAQDDRVVGAVLTLMHEQPGQTWTLAGLAAAVGWSRATVARRFSDLLGEPPMAYLARWRLELAADLLRTSTDTVESIARQVGYENAFAFSAAFKRVHGLAPRAYRAA